MPEVFLDTAILTQRDYEDFRRGGYIKFGTRSTKSQVYNFEEVCDLVGRHMKEHYRDEESYMDDLADIEKTFYMEGYYSYNNTIIESYEAIDLVNWRFLTLGDKYIVVRAYFSE